MTEQLLCQAGCHRGNGDRAVPGEERQELLQPVRPAAQPRISGKRDPGLRQSLGSLPWGHTSLLARGCSSPFQPPPVPEPRGKGERKSVRVSPTQGASRAPLQGLSNAGMSQQHLPSPHTTALTLHHGTQLPAAPASPPKWMPGNKTPPCPCPEDSSAPGRSWPGRSPESLPPHRGPSSPRPARSRGMFSLSSPAGLDTLLFSHCFSKESLFITADPWGKSFFLSLSLSHAFIAGTVGKEVFLHLNLRADRHGHSAAPRLPACPHLKVPGSSRHHGPRERPAKTLSEPFRNPHLRNPHKTPGRTRQQTQLKAATGALPSPTCSQLSGGSHYIFQRFLNGFFFFFPLPPPSS